MIHLDTQVAVWLYFQNPKQISAVALKTVARAKTVVMSPIVLVELEILIEIGRISVGSAEDIVTALSAELGLTLSQASLQDLSRNACRFAWTREPFDRLIVANAMADGAKLVTADKRILANFKDAVW